MRKSDRKCTVRRTLTDESLGDGECRLPSSSLITYLHFRTNCNSFLKTSVIDTGISSSVTRFDIHFSNFFRIEIFRKLFNDVLEIWRNIIFISIF